MGHIDGLDEIPIRHISEAEVIRARRTVCSHAVDVSDAGRLLAMLGLGPTSEERSGGKRGVTVIGNRGRCVRCGVPTGSPKDPNWGGAAYGGLGRCEKCYGRLRRERAKEVQ